jgi:hypothetical protein
LIPGVININRKSQVARVRAGIEADGKIADIEVRPDVFPCIEEFATAEFLVALTKD